MSQNGSRRERVGGKEGLRWRLGRFLWWPWVASWGASSGLLQAHWRLADFFRGPALPPEALRQAEGPEAAFTQNGFYYGPEFCANLPLSGGLSGALLPPLGTVSEPSGVGVSIASYNCECVAVTLRSCGARVCIYIYIFLSSQYMIPERRLPYHLHCSGQQIIQHSFLKLCCIPSHYLQAGMPIPGAEKHPKNGPGKRRFLVFIERCHMFRLSRMSHAKLQKQETIGATQ